MDHKINGLITWTEPQIDARDNFIRQLSGSVRAGLIATNPAWHLIRIESSILTPLSEINPSYSEDDFFAMNTLGLRPETTAGSYEYLYSLLKAHPPKWQRPPICVWQAGKSFRKEQDQPSKYCRLKEFYQLEFQCVYAKDSKCDYHTRLVEHLHKSVALLLNRPVRVVASDRLPSYSTLTTDLEVRHKGRWLEIASISKRNDFMDEYEVLEIALGLDRLVIVADTPVT